ncbi:hypothetical protein EA661_12240 [Pseudoxanthomonas winnipegensis]|uniref:Uncharacterized protein n=1 Tax=Pseudoxanthomonas winnipegensis TaxID=2480810 RepID=A0A4Q8LHS5_9GAMM|nr:fimbria/pilus outer membrane usher protein [Pseudoxanthomonas winnipegensis]TAA29051.1 hypothetical protein EA661_12240 [Pseudoxanthomonas winnipegensis]
MRLIERGGLPEEMPEAVKALAEQTRQETDTTASYFAERMVIEEEGTWTDKNDIRLAKDPAALDPLTPTWPVPTLGGIALDPGQVKVLSNQAEITRQDVKAGPFTVDSRNVALGASQTAVVVRDAYGRETAVSTARLYVAPTLLRRGLSAWEIAAGQVREDENRYGTAGVSASWARGVNDRWTIRAGGQVDEKGKGNVTVGSTWAPGTWGVLDGEVGRSSDGGTRWAVAYGYKGPTFGVRLEHEENDGFWRLQSETALPIASRTQASVSYRPDRRFTLRGTYSAIDTGRSSLAFASLSVSANLGTAGQVSANVLRDLQGDDLQVSASYTYRFGSKASVGVRARQAPGQDGCIRILHDQRIGLGTRHRAPRKSGRCIVVIRAEAGRQCLARGKRRGAELERGGFADPILGQRHARALIDLGHQGPARHCGRGGGGRLAWAVSHSVDDAVGIVADQKCTALRHRQTDGPCDMRLAVATYSCPLAMASPCAPGREKTTFGSASKAPSSLASSSNSTSP